MSTKIEALKKILELTLSGNRVSYFYRRFNYEKDQLCYCALGCLLDENELDYLDRTGSMTLNIQSSNGTIQRILMKLIKYGFTGTELYEIQRKNDKLNDNDFLKFISDKINQEKSML